MSDKFNVEIITPENSVLKAEAVEVIIPSYEGLMGILKDHIPLITFLRPGIIIVKDDKERKYYVEEGTVEFSNNNLLVLTSTVENISNLNSELITSKLSEAQKKLESLEISDKEKYYLTYKIDTLKTISG
tara:strand:- start:5213 stop:5602 length:390 start_codon:yes stop_codon:yes gene_type:complete